MSEKGVVGSRGEGLAAELLRKEGFTIIDRNHRVPGGEIDVVARAPDGTLVLCEVKTLVGTPAGLDPEDNVTKAKLTKMRRAAEAYVATQKKMVWESSGWRIDVVAVVLNDPPIIRRYENV
jgi:putative endonuclease